MSRAPSSWISVAAICGSAVLSGGSALLLGCGAGDVGPAGESAPGPEGPPGPAGRASTPSIAAISPNEVFLGRRVPVLISGHDTAWEAVESLSYDFGEGITVHADTAHLASPSALIVEIEIADDAPRGLRSFAVLDDGEEARLDGALAVALPTTVGAFLNGGSTAQGSILAVPVFQHDVSTPFDAITPENFGAYLQGGSKNLDPTSPYYRMEIPDSYFAQGIVLIDVFHPAGPADIFVDIGAPGDADTVTSRAEQAITVIERAPVPLALGTTHDTVEVQFDSRLFSLETTSTAPVVVDLTLTSDEPGFESLLSALPESGRFDEAVAHATNGQLRFVSTQPQRYYVVHWTVSNAVDYQVHIERVEAEVIAVDLGVPYFSPVFDMEGSAFYQVPLQKGVDYQVSIAAGNTSLCGDFGPGFIVAEVIVLDSDARKPLAFGFPEGPNGCPTTTFAVPSDGTYFIEVRLPFLFVPTVDYSLLVEAL